MLTPQPGELNLKVSGRLCLLAILDGSVIREYIRSAMSCKLSCMLHCDFAASNLTWSWLCFHQLTRPNREVILRQTLGSLISSVVCLRAPFVGLRVHFLFGGSIYMFVAQIGKFQLARFRRWRRYQESVFSNKPASWQNVRRLPTASEIAWLFLISILSNLQPLLSLADRIGINARQVGSGLIRTAAS